MVYEEWVDKELEAQKCYDRMRIDRYMYEPEAQYADIEKDQVRDEEYYDMMTIKVGNEKILVNQVEVKFEGYSEEIKNKFKIVGNLQSDLEELLMENIMRGLSWSNLSSLIAVANNVPELIVLLKLQGYKNSGLDSATENLIKGYLEEGFRQSFLDMILAESLTLRQLKEVLSKEKMALKTLHDQRDIVGLKELMYPYEKQERYTAMKRQERIDNVLKSTRVG